MKLDEITDKKILKSINKHSMTDTDLDVIECFDDLKKIIRKKNLESWRENNKDYYKQLYIQKKNGTYKAGEIDYKKNTVIEKKVIDKTPSKQKERISEYNKEYYKKKKDHILAKIKEKKFLEIIVIDDTCCNCCKCQK